MENNPKRSPSILEYILNHRQDILDKLENNKYFENFDNENIINDKTLTNDIENLIKDEIIEKKIYNKNRNYYNLIKWYWIYLFYGFIGGIFINSISNTKIIRYDMFFNVLFSPLIYYHSPKNILTNISKNRFIKFYTIPFLIGLLFRFLEYIPALSLFVLDPNYIISTLDYVLVSVILFFILLLSFYYLFIILLFHLLLLLQIISASIFF